MGQIRAGLIGLLAAVALVATLAPGSAAAAAKNRKHAEGTVYDTTCVTACLPRCPPPPHCGPLPQRRGAGADVICAQARQLTIVCPLAVTPSPPPVCVRAEGCPRFGVYMGEGAVINVRRRGSAKLLARLAVVDGYFKIWLGPGEYVLHPYLPEEPCWSGAPARVKVTARQKSPVPASVYVHDSCVAHPDAIR